MQLYECDGVHCSTPTGICSMQPRSGEARHITLAVVLPPAGGCAPTHMWFSTPKTLYPVQAAAR